MEKYPKVIYAGGSMITFLLLLIIPFNFIYIVKNIIYKPFAKLKLLFIITCLTVPLLLVLLSLFLPREYLLSVLKYQPFIFFIILFFLIISTVFIAVNISDKSKKSGQIVLNSCYFLMLLGTNITIQII